MENRASHRLTRFCFQLLLLFTLGRSVICFRPVIPNNGATLVRRQSNERPVYFMNNQEGDEVTIPFNLPSYRFKAGPVSPNHSWIYIQDDGDLLDPTNRSSVRVEIGWKPDQYPDSRGIHVRFFDWASTPASIADEKSTGGKYAELVGLTELTNNELMDPETGKGLIAEIVAADPEYRIGEEHYADYNGCHRFSFSLLAKLGIDWRLQSRTLKLFERQVLAYNAVVQGAKYKVPLTSLAHITAGADRSQNRLTNFNLADICQRASTGGVCVRPVPGQVNVQLSMRGDDLDTQVLPIGMMPCYGKPSMSAWPIVRTMTIPTGSQVTVPPATGDDL